MQPEILYSSQGTKGTYERFNSFIEPTTTGSIDYRDSRNFLSIPLLTRFDISEKFSLELGQQLGFLLNVVSVSDGERRSNSGNFQFDIGPTLGVG